MENMQCWGAPETWLGTTSVVYVQVERHFMSYKPYQCSGNQ